ncbi:transposase [Brevibacillus laterosporus]|uniref:Transposase n=1 Tax=Brevibacillus laterosporus TaxID=1465 RepID=A0AAP8QFR8_BRELA|nr:transposase [Brevibacillus laterosporus]PPA80864.1 transposase [Brevibacillus laterosporus]PPB08908.1 transposase [Brevibacillus laterosporus]
MTVKGQKFKSYPESLKMEDIRLHMEERGTYKLEIQDKDRLKKWMRKYRQQGVFGLLDRRGRCQTFIDQDRYVQKLK